MAIFGSGLSRSSQPLVKGTVTLATRLAVTDLCYFVSGFQPMMSLAARFYPHDKKSRISRDKRIVIATDNFHIRF